MIGPPVAGSVFDATQSYDVPFYMAGGFLILASFVSFGAELVLLFQIRNKKIEEKQDFQIK
jgi:cyanate permease